MFASVRIWRLVGGPSSCGEPRCSVCHKIVHCHRSG